MNFAGISHEAIHFTLHFLLVNGDEEFSRPIQTNKSLAFCCPTRLSLAPRVKHYVASNISYARRNGYLSQIRLPGCANQLLWSVAAVHSRGSASRLLALGRFELQSPGLAQRSRGRSCTATDWAWPNLHASEAHKALT